MSFSSHSSQAHDPTGSTSELIKLLQELQAALNALPLPQLQGSACAPVNPGRSVQARPSQSSSAEIQPEEPDLFPDNEDMEDEDELYDFTDEEEVEDEDETPARSGPVHAPEKGRAGAASSGGASSSARTGRTGRTGGSSCEGAAFSSRAAGANGAGSGDSSGGEIRCFHFSPLAVRLERELLRKRKCSTPGDLLLEASYSLSGLVDLMQAVQPDAELKGFTVNSLGRLLESANALVFRISDAYSTVEPAR